MDDVSHTPSHNVSHMPSTNARSGPDTFQRIEVITGVGRRRRWTAAEKERMVSESLVPGASASEVARRYGVNANQLFAWRRQFQSDERSESNEVPGFAPVVLSAPGPEAAARGGTIEVVIGRMVVRVDGPVDVARLHQVLDTVRRLA